jgi:hypothetical protein
MFSEVVPSCGWKESSVHTTSTVSPVTGSVFE